VSYSQAQGSAILHRIGFAGSAAQVIAAFQTGYNLGSWLTVDGLCGPATSAAIARSVAAGSRASAHFTWREVRCKCGGHPGCRGILTDHKLMQGLERYRTLPGVGAVTIESGYRCPLHNVSVGGAPSSQHVQGKAADVRGRLRLNKIEAMHFFNGKGFQQSTGLVVHLDVRPVWVLPWKYLT
jgi:zinc D-Ala-D-Ala carboxypeptidase